MSAKAPVTVRAARSADAEAIADVNLNAWQLADPGIMANSYLVGLEKCKATATQRHRERLDGAHGVGTFELVAEHHGEVVGWLPAGPTGDEDGPETQGEIWAIYVHPDAWRSGVGNALMAAALEHLANDGYSEATLWVFEQNAGARLFYERFGWRADGATELFERGGRQAIEIRYRRPL